MAQRVLEAAGLDQEKDIRRERLDPGKSTDAIKDRKLDAYFWVGGIPTAAVTDLGATPGTKLKLVDHAEVVDNMNKKYGPLYIRDTIPAKAYPGQDQPNQVATVQNLIIARADMSDQVAYNIVKTIFEKRDELILVHKEATNFDLKLQTNDASPIPFHPGRDQVLQREGHQDQIERELRTAPWRLMAEPAVPVGAGSHCADRHRRAAAQGRGIHRR